MSRNTSIETIAKRLAKRAKARTKSLELAKELAKKKAAGREKVFTNLSNPTPPYVSKSEENKPSKPWAKVRAGEAELRLYKRTEPGQALQVQPWAVELVSTLLEAADVGGTYLCLVWPVQFDTVAELHALASLERNFVRDLRGLRTLVYPGRHSTRTALQSVLIDRPQLSTLCRSLWNVKGAEGQIMANTKSESFEALLRALNDICLHNPEVVNPSLGEIVPTFIFDSTENEWRSVVTNPLERSLRNVESLARRRIIRQQVDSEWGNPKSAPGALMVTHFSTRKAAWKKALSASALEEQGKPEILLLDATSISELRSNGAVRRIPEFLKFASENGYDSAGSVVITDDPKTFFVMRARLAELKPDMKHKVWAAEGDKAILSENPVPVGWSPEQRPNTIFKIAIIDAEASKIASAFQKLARDAGGNDTLGYEALMEACLYLMRLSNMPAGYKDLTEKTAEDGVDFGSQRNSWAAVRLRILAAFEAGYLNSRRVEIEKAMLKAEQLIDLWSDSTPMGLRLLEEVNKLGPARSTMRIVLPNERHKLLVRRFLQRKLGDQWSPIEPQLYFTTYSTFERDLINAPCGKQLVFVGINRNVLRLLVTNRQIPHGTIVLGAHKQAASILLTLKSMMTLDAFKPYRGIMGLLIQQIDLRLQEVPSMFAFEQLTEMKMTFQLEENNEQSRATDHTYFRFELEGGGRAYSSGWIYRYEPDSDPAFSKTSAKSIKEGDLIFEMTEEFKNKLESVLNLRTDGMSSVSSPQRILLKLYHADVKSRCELFFKETKRSKLAREIHEKMVSIDPTASKCKPSRIYYWLDLGDEGDTRPHAPKDAKYFRLFCKALQIDDDKAANNHWNLIRNARAFNQNLGRLLSARYAEILFQPESVATYRQVSSDAIIQLQQEAMSCIYRVERVIPPA